HVLDVMHRQGVKGVYVNCWENKTLYFVADRIVREQRILFAEKTEAVLKLERFQRTLGNKPFVLVLDEIDKPVPAERDAILYHLSGIGNVGLVCICNSRSFLLSLDQRILSRLGLRAIGFEPYSQEEMRAILKERAEAGLRKGTWDEETLLGIVRLSEGDARVAIQTLKNAAESAEARRSPAIGEEDITGGYGIARELKQHYLLSGLTEHHRIIFDLVKAAGEQGVLSNTLWQSYLNRCTERGKKPVATRTFSAYIATLLGLGLIQEERAPLRGNLRLLKVCKPEGQ
ncbi:MAG: hypothetical protein QXE50_08180, partial [Nitrososphaerota archaeon]